MDANLQKPVHQFKKVEIWYSYMLQTNYSCNAKYFSNIDGEYPASIQGRVLA